jgi:hypothetical protein
MNGLLLLVVQEMLYTRPPGINCCESVGRCTLRGGLSPSLESTSSRVNLELPHTEVDLELEISVYLRVADTEVVSKATSWRRIVTRWKVEVV